MRYSNLSVMVVEEVDGVVVGKTAEGIEINTEHDRGMGRDREGRERERRKGEWLTDKERMTRCVDTYQAEAGRDERLRWASGMRGGWIDCVLLLLCLVITFLLVVVVVVVPVQSVAVINSSCPLGLSLVLRPVVSGVVLSLR
jgi:hypothetical protein